jgi:hypothetical protein
MSGTIFLVSKHVLYMMFLERVSNQVGVIFLGTVRKCVTVDASRYGLHIGSLHSVYVRGAVPRIDQHSPCRR